MKPAICLEMIYPELEPVARIKKLADLGFEYVEFWGWQDKDISQLISTCIESRVKIVNFSGQRQGSLVAPDTHELVQADLKTAISVAEQLDCSTLMLLTNELGEGGVVTNSYDDIPDEKKYENVRIGLEKALQVIPPNISLVLEPLNTRLDHPGYYLSDMKTSVSLIREIGHPRLKVLCDLYHIGMMGEDLNGVITNYLDDIGYIHIADVPGRHEPGTGQINWDEALTLLRTKGYTGYVGFEYVPVDDSEVSLKTIYSLWERVMA
ncbi:MAG: TIM barrel protein [bacterium]|nr:TIM barrel protein [bacterium]